MKLFSLFWRSFISSLKSFRGIIPHFWATPVFLRFLLEPWGPNPFKGIPLTPYWDEFPVWNLFPGSFNPICLFFPGFKGLFLGLICWGVSPPRAKEGPSKGPQWGFQGFFSTLCVGGLGGFFPPFVFC